jgi:hypothetical protein
MPQDKDALLRQTERQLTEMQERAIQVQPGLEEVLRVYGGYEAAVNQVTAYFAAMNPIPHYFTTTSSGVSKAEHGDVE